MVALWRMPCGIHPLLTVGLALGKEYGDSQSPGNRWDWWDIAADAVGIAIGTTMRWLIFYR